MLVDSHCHLDHADFRGEVEAVIARAKAAGIATLLTICTELDAVPGLLAIAAAHPNVFCTVGIHPHDAAGGSDLTPERLVELAGNPKVVGIGECGLDYFYTRSPRETQRQVFRTHIAAARETGLPLVVHARDADDDIIQILREESRAGAFGGVMHCFNSGESLAACALDIGFAISLSGILTFKKSTALQAIAKSLPRDSLLVETDAPYLAPVPLRGRRNEPSFVVHTLNALAALRDEDPATLAQATTTNFFRVFTKAGTA